MKTNIKVQRWENWACMEQKDSNYDQEYRQ